MPITVSNTSIQKNTANVRCQVCIRDVTRFSVNSCFHGRKVKGAPQRGGKQVRLVSAMVPAATHVHNLELNGVSTLPLIIQIYGPAK